MTPKQFKLYLDRDQSRCYHCGITGDQLIPQHRAGRGMGGSKIRNRISNIIVFCSNANGALESDPEFAQLGRELGWKLSAYEDPTTTPIFEAWSGSWWILNDEGSRREVKNVADLSQWAQIAE